MKCFVFADESGNSGLKLFDDGQDTFWTGTVIAFANRMFEPWHFHISDIRLPIEFVYWRDGPCREKIPLPDRKTDRRLRCQYRAASEQ
jgi:hypothetical protein